MTKVQAIDRIVYAVLGVIALLVLIEFGNLMPNEGDRAAEAYEQARNSGASDDQLCRSAEAVGYAYAAAGDDETASRWASDARAHCANASIRRYLNSKGAY